MTVMISVIMGFAAGAYCMQVKHRMFGGSSV